MSHQILVGLAEVVVPEEAPVSRQGRGVGRLQHQVPVAVYELALALGIGPPQDEDQMLALLGQFVDDGIGEGFPPFALVRSGPMRLDRERGVEQQYPLASPAGEVAALGYGNT